MLAERPTWQSVRFLMAKIEQHCHYNILNMEMIKIRLCLHIRIYDVFIGLHWISAHKSTKGTQIWVLCVVAFFLVNMNKLHERGKFWQTHGKYKTAGDILWYYHTFIAGRHFLVLSWGIHGQTCLQRECEREKQKGWTKSCKALADFVLFTYVGQIWCWCKLVDNKLSISAKT